MRADTQTFDRLLMLPFFQGVSRGDLSQIIANVNFGILNYTRNKVIVSDGQVCDRLYFITNGKVKVRSTADDHGYVFVEELPAPNVIQAERLFGLTQRFTRDFIADTICRVVTINKKDVLKLSDNYEIFRLNMLNIISTQLQRQERMPWKRQRKGIRQRITWFIESHCMRLAGKKQVRINMGVLAKEINCTRLKVSIALNDMQNDGLITLHRGYIDIPAIEKLLM